MIDMGVRSSRDPLHSEEGNKSNEDDQRREQFRFGCFGGGLGNQFKPVLLGCSFMKSTVDVLEN